MGGFLVDTDAFIAFRQLSTLELFRNTTPLPPLHMTEFIASYELNSVASDIKKMRSNGELTIHSVRTDSNGMTLFRKLRQGGVDKGEAEAIAWASASNFQGYFVFNDGRARRAAKSKSVASCDLFGFLLKLIELGTLNEEDVHAKTAHWQDPGSSFGKPRDFTTFEETAQKRNR